MIPAFEGPVFIDATPGAGRRWVLRGELPKARHRIDVQESHHG